MTTKLESVHNGAFLLREDHGSISRDIGIVASGQNLLAGTVVSLTSGKWNPFDADGSHPVGVLYNNTDATNADTKAVVITRKAEVDAAQLIWPAGYTNTQIANGREFLSEAGITTR